jgi:hypothetical protein
MHYVGFQAATVRKPTVVNYRLSFSHLQCKLSGTFPKTMCDSLGATWYKPFPCLLLWVHTFPKKGVVGKVSAVMGGLTVGFRTAAAWNPEGAMDEFDRGGGARL